MATTSTTSSGSLSNPLEGLFGRLGSEAVEGVPEASGLFGFLGGIWDVYSLIALSVSAVLIFGIIYAYLRYGQYKQHLIDKHEAAHKAWKEIHEGTPQNARWLDVQKHIDSENPNDWKLAIIEADIMLESALEGAGYAGNTISEQLKSVSATALPSLNDAWQAHKVRNQIAHQGVDFVLTQKVARETILQYQRAFKDLGVL